MHVLFIVGSRSSKGQTATAVAAYAAGCERADASTEVIYLPQLDIQSCRQCGPDNWGTCKSRGECCIKDDLHTVIERIRQADAVVFATPVFYDDVAESMQAFTRRLRRTTSNEKGREGIAKPAAVIAMAGARGKGSSSCCANLESMVKGIGMDVVDIHPIRKQNLAQSKAALEQAGSDLAMGVLEEA